MDRGGHHIQVQVIVKGTQVVKNVYVIYKMHITIKRHETLVWETDLCKRFSDFISLKNELENEIQNSDFPYELPKRQYGLWSKQLSLTDDVIEERKVKLGKFLYDLLNDTFDTKWRNSMAITRFLELPARLDRLLSDSYRKMAGSSRDETNQTWISLYRDGKNELEECRELEATNRTKRLIQLRLKVNYLEKTLERDEEGETKIENSEIEKRRNLLSILKQDINSLSLQSSIPENINFNSKNTNVNYSGKALNSLNNPNALGTFQTRPPVGRRRFGETEQTAQLDNQKLMTQHMDTMQDQDQELTQLHKVIRRQKDISIQMNQELSQQNDLLDSFNNDLDQTAGKLKLATRRAKEFNDSA